MFLFSFLDHVFMSWLLNQHQRCCFSFFPFSHVVHGAISLNKLFRGRKLESPPLKFHSVTDVTFAVALSLEALNPSRCCVALTPCGALKRVSQSDPVQCFYLHYNLLDVFMDFFRLVFQFFQKYSAVNYYYCCYCQGCIVIFLIAYCLNGYFGMTIGSQPRLL